MENLWCHSSSYRHSCAANCLVIAFTLVNSLQGLILYLIVATSGGPAAAKKPSSVLTNSGGGRLWMRAVTATMESGYPIPPAARAPRGGARRTKSAAAKKDK